MKGRKVLSFLAVACAAVVGLSTQTTAYATSRTTTTEVLGVSRTADEAIDAQVLGARRDAGVVTDDVTTSLISDQQAVQKLNDSEAIVKTIVSQATAIAKEISSGQIVQKGKTSSPKSNLSSDEIAVIDSFDVKPTAGTTVSEENPIYISFTFPGVTENTKAYVLHFENGNWVVVPTTVAEGVIIGRFTSLSPVAIVVEKNTLKGAVLGASRAVSPRTGDGMGLAMYLVIGFLVILSTVGFVSRKRSKQ